MSEYGPETPFTINIPDDEIDYLRNKLALTRFPDELENVGRDYGTPLTDVKRFVARWKDGYDWRKYEKELNDELPQFKRTIQVDNHGELDIHISVAKWMVRFRSCSYTDVRPGSFIEVRKILPLLIQSADNSVPSFHVVALSLPGYGFSSAPKQKGFGISQFAEVGNKLMLSLGYEKYVTQGGDWGSVITREIAVLYGGKTSMAWHDNFPRLSKPNALEPSSLSPENLASFTVAEKEGLERTKRFMNEGQGYFMEQSTQPQTLGYGLADSPAGLLGWVYEKLVNWTDSYPWEDDEVLTWISIYWFSSAGPAASLRIYYERQHGPDPASDPEPTIPLGYSFFPKELIVAPRSWTKTPYVVFEAEHDSGGHFAAHEKPNELVGDLRKMFGKGGPAYGVIPEAKGYLRIM